MPSVWFQSGHLSQAGNVFTILSLTHAGQGSRTARLSYLRSCVLQFHQAIFQPLNFGDQLRSLLGQQVLVKFDLLQKGLGGGIVVAPLGGQVHPGHLVDRCVHV